jgi:hypothetical protein
LYNLLMSEFNKLKRMKLLLLISAGIMIPAITGIVKWNNIRKSYGSVIDMNYEFPLVEQEISNGILMIVIVFIAVIIFMNEYRNKEMENLFSYPYNRVQFVIAKLIAIFIITSFMILVIYLLSVIYGLLVMRGISEWMLLYYHLKVCLVIILLLFSVVPICLTVCIISRSYILPVAVSVVIYLLNPQLIEIPFLRILPWNVPYYMIQSMQLTLDPRYELFKIQNYFPYVLSSILAFIFPTIFILRYYSRMEIF